MYVGRSAAHKPSQVSLIMLKTVDFPILKLNDYSCFESPVARYFRQTQRRSFPGIGIHDRHASFVMYGATVLSKCSNLSGDILRNLEILINVEK